MKSGLNPLSTASTKLCIVLEPAAAAHFPADQTLSLVFVDGG